MIALLSTKLNSEFKGLFSKHCDKIPIGVK